MNDMPAPLTSPDCDCTDLDGFMLNVERLMASELVALSSHEAIAAALFIWCRAWKQKPAASLPDDDRVNAAFARLPLPRFLKLKPQIMHGFVKCSDGRLYHKHLASEATRAFERKGAFQRKREADAERLRKWRSSKGETAHETEPETHVETRFVAEGQGQGQVLKKEDNHHRPAPPSSEADDDQFDYEVLLDSLCTAAGIERDQRMPGLQITGPITDLIDAGWSLQKHILPKLREMREKNKYGGSWEYYATAVKNGKRKPPKAEAPPSEPIAETFSQRQDREWRQQLTGWKKYGKWSDHWGAEPGSPTCLIPLELISEFEKPHVNGASQ